MLTKWLPFKISGDKVHKNLPLNDCAKRVYTITPHINSFFMKIIPILMDTAITLLFSLDIEKLSTIVISIKLTNFYNTCKQYFCNPFFEKFRIKDFKWPPFSYS